MIARHHARRNPARAQHEHECAREVLAEAAPAVEHEHVDGIGLVVGRRERVDVFLVVEFPEDGGNEASRVGVRFAKGAGELDGALVAPAELEVGSGASDPGVAAYDVRNTERWTYWRVSVTGLFRKIC